MVAEKPNNSFLIGNSKFLEKLGSLHTIYTCMCMHTGTSVNLIVTTYSGDLIFVKKHSCIVMYLPQVAKGSVIQDVMCN